MANLQLAEYDPRWPSIYELEARRIMRVLDATIVAVEHVGSTAVPGLAAKPTIDIAVGVRSLGLPPDCVERMAAIGYREREERTGRPEHVFRRGTTFPWEAIVHVVEYGGPMWSEYLCFRDALRTDDRLRNEYARLKRQLLADRADWYRGLDKQGFIRRVLDRSVRTIEVLSSSAEETEALAARLAERLREGDVVTVSGELGSGKTTFVRGACRALGVVQPVTSPTFTVGHRYHGRVDVSHLDLFRFTGLSPAEWGDLEPYFDDAIAFVEWPEAGEGTLPSPRVRVRLEHVDETRRRISFDTAESALLEGMEDAHPRVRHGD